MVIRTLSILIAVIIVFGYAYFRTLPYFKGPQITISSPTDGTTVADQTLTITGTTERISTIHLNGRKIFIDKENSFRETILLFPGYNVITVDALDRFDKPVEKQIRIIYKEPQSQT